MTYRMCAIIVMSMPLAASDLNAAPSTKEVMLQDVWKPSPVGVIIQIPNDTTLVMAPRDDGNEYTFGGKRLVIRAAKVKLKSVTKIRAYAEGQAPAAPSSYSAAAQPGPDGTDGGGNGQDGTAGADGRTGDPGHPAGQIALIIGEVSGDGNLILIASGEMGGPGQIGQEGGKGGKSGRGSDSAKTWPNCDYGGGDAGNPGNGGPGGRGGKGGPGGPASSVRYTATIQEHTVVITDGALRPTLGAGKILIDLSGGPGGVPGKGGTGGDGGDGNDGGAGGGACGGGNGKGKAPRMADQTVTLGTGDRGPSGSASILP